MDENGYGHGIYNGVDADSDEAHSLSLKESSTGFSKRLSQMSGKDPRHPILLGSLDELEVGKRGIRRKF